MDIGGGDSTVSERFSEDWKPRSEASEWALFRLVWHFSDPPPPLKEGPKLIFGHIPREATDTVSNDLDLDPEDVGETCNSHASEGLG